MLKKMLTVVMIGSSIGVAQASLLDGKTVGYEYLFPTISTTYGSAPNGNYVVGPGVELTSGGGALCCSEGNLDISDTQLDMSWVLIGGSYTSDSFNGFHIFDVNGTIAPFSSVTVNALTNMTGFGAANVTFDADNIWVNWQGLSFDEQTRVVLDVAAVPEPSVLALLGLGIVGALVSRRRGLGGRG